MSDTPRKRARVVRAFTDAGTGERFDAGATPMLEHGAFANYEAAGLVTVPPVAAKVAAPKRQSSSKSRSRAKARAAAPAVPAKPAETPQSGDAAPST